MASLGRIANSVLSGVNENTLALANLNFDFSLVTLQAPAEYSAVGRALTVGRRQNAEHGKTHKIARKLGALFERLIPQAPKLFEAYGRRVSEIMETPGVNPPGTDQHGPFAAFVGADGTSIWAAATSGSASIAIHLLACLLARAFDARGATSVWAELVLERQREIEKSTESSFMSVMALADANAAAQEISREELLQWDASARAWLQCADGAKRKERTQMLLILKNIGVPVAVGSSTYDGVIRAWKQAMTALSRLLNGEPQSVTDGAILLALSAWHLYPDLVVLGNETTNITFQDPLMHPGGLVTVGLTNANADLRSGEGMHWSLALSHYRYYGDPIKAIGGKQNRFTMQQLHLVALGSLLGIWNLPRGDPFPAARYFIALWKRIQLAQPRVSELHWLQILATAAGCLLNATGEELDINCALVDFGQRRGRNLLWHTPRVGSDEQPLPWFGLRMPHIFASLSCSTSLDSGIQYLREIAKAGKLKCEDAVITVTAKEKMRANPAYGGIPIYAFATSAPHLNQIPLFGKEEPIETVPELEDDDQNLPGAYGSANSQKGADSRSKHPTKYDVRENHARWVSSTSSLASPENRFRDDRHEINSSAENSATDVLQYIVSKLNQPGASGETTFRLFPKSKFNVFSSRPEESILLKSCLRDCDALWYHAPSLFGSEGNKICKPHCSCLTLPTTERHATFGKVLNSTQTCFNLWIRNSESFCARRFEEQVELLRKGVSQSYVDLETITQALENGEINGQILLEYLDGADPLEEDEFAKPLIEMMRAERQQLERVIKALRNLTLATDIYGHLEGATISSSIVEEGLMQARWSAGRDLSYVTRPMMFACIAMLETGYVNLDPKTLEEVMALSSGNSIFVSSALLSDPEHQPKQHSITRIVGNIGRPGVSLLVPPAGEPRIRPLSGYFRAVSYAPFDRKREDNFRSTTLHLSFTGFEFPLGDGTSGMIDQQIFLVETVVSAHDRGEWVADLNVLKALDRKMVPTLSNPKLQHDQDQCIQSAPRASAGAKSFSSIDSWEEILDTPPGVGVIRSNNNWCARLAAAVLLAQTQMREVWESNEAKDVSSDDRKFDVIGNCKDICWHCVYRKLPRHVRREQSGCYYLID